MQKRLTPREHDILENALTEYLVMLRTIKTPTDMEGRTLTEAAFYASGISQGRRSNYDATKDLLALVRSGTAATITVQ